MIKNFVVAIDGVAGAGKSTVATKVARALKFKKLNTGDIYRAITVKYISTKFEIKNATDAKKFVDTLNIKLVYDSKHEQHTYLDGNDITHALHSFEVSSVVSTISKYKSIRDYVTEMQREIAKKKNVVVEGRDIGSHVLPNADYKIFLIASADIRAERQFRELVSKGDKKVTLEGLKKQIVKRDYNDMHRRYGALKISENAHVIDTSNLTIDQVVEKCLEFIKGTN